MKWRIRRARPEESEAVAVFFRRVAPLALPFMVAHTPEEDRWFFREQVFGRCAVWLADADGTLIGFCAARRGWIDQLYIDEPWRGRGVGRSLLTRALKGRRHVRLWTFQVNARARRFYAGQGFEEIRFTDGRDNEEKEPDVLLEWRRTDPPGERSRAPGKKAWRPSLREI